MTEQEYSDLTDLQLARSIVGILRLMNCHDEPNKTIYSNVSKDVRSIISNLENKIEGYLDD